MVRDDGPPYEGIGAAPHFPVDEVDDFLLLAFF